METWLWLEADYSMCEFLPSSPRMALQTQHHTLVCFDYTNLLYKSPYRNSLFCRNKAKKKIPLRVFTGRAWRYSGTTKVKF